MDASYGVIAVYAALAIWAGLLFIALWRKQYQAFLGFGIALLLALNVRYFTDGAPNAIAFFIGIYDVLINVGLPGGAEPAAMMGCANNDCTVWGDQFALHPAWGVAFYERFLTGGAFRSNLLYGHIFFNSVTFVLMHVQLLWPGTLQQATHRWLGRLTFATLTLGVGCAVWLASEHGTVGAYGGMLSTLGFYFMSACVYICAVMGVVSIRRGDFATHRIWMIRFAGAMWGSFWLFRVLLFIVDPLFREFATIAILTCIWFSAPAGILIAEFFRVRAKQENPGELLDAAGLAPAK